MEKSYFQENKSTITVVIVVLLVLLCCCCIASTYGLWVYGDAIVAEFGL